MLPVFRFSYPSSIFAHHRLQNFASSVGRIHHCLLLHRAVSGFNRPIIDSFQIFRTCNRPIDLLPDSHDRPIVDSFPGSFVSRVTLSCTTKNSLKCSSGLHRTVAGVHSAQLHHVVTFTDVSRFTAFCSTVQYLVCIRLASRFQQLVSKLIRLVSKLGVTLFTWILDPLLT